MKTAQKIAQLLLSFALIGFLVYKTDFNQIRDALSKVKYGFFAYAILLSIVSFYLPSLMTSRLLQRFRIFRSPWEVLRIGFESIYYAMVVPADVAAGAVRIHRLTQKEGAQLSHRVTDGVTVLICERLFHVIVLMLFLGVLSIYTSDVIRVWALGVQKGVAAFFVLGIVAFLLFKNVRYFKDASENAKAGSLKQKIFQNINALADLPTSDLMIYFFLILLYQLVNLIGIDCLFLRSTGIPMPYIDYFFIAVLVRLARFVPISWSGIGVREGIMGWGLQLFGFSFEQGVLIGLLGTAQLLILAAIGATFELQRHFSKQPRH